MEKVISIFVSLLLASQSTLALNCNFYGEKLAAAGWAPQPLFSDADLAVLEEYELKHSKLGKIIPATPKSLEDIYFGEQDFPLSMIDQQAEQSVQFWKNKAPKHENYWKSYRLDWQVFRDLNLQAHDVWNAMKDCNRVDLSKMRGNYFRGAPCPTAAGSRLVYVKISELTANLFQYLDTMPLIHNGPGLVGSTPIEIPYQHPLLYQVVLQTWATVLNYFTEKKREDAVLLNPAIWERTNAETRNRSMADFLRDNPHLNRLQYSDQYQNWVKINLNLSSMVAGQNADCSALGLWPALNRALIFGSDFNHNQRAAYMLESANFAEAKFEEACGYPLKISKALPKTYNGYGLAHISESRRLFQIYFQPQKNTDVFLAGAMKATKATFNDLVCK